jgi:tRNA pseudouridine13 synthase
MIIVVYVLTQPLFSRMMHVVTSFDKSEKKYSLSDVVLPLIGTNTLLPENSVRDKISQLLKEAGLTFASFKLKPLHLAVPGSYRKLLGHPRNLSWKILPKLPVSDSQHSKLADSVQIKVTLSTSSYATVFLREIMKDRKEGSDE